MTRSQGSFCSSHCTAQLGTRSKLLEAHELLRKNTWIWFLFSARDGTQGLAHVRQAPYHWAIFPAQYMISFETTVGTQKSLEWMNKWRAFSMAHLVNIRSHIMSITEKCTHHIPGSPRTSLVYIHTFWRVKNKNKQKSISNHVSQSLMTLIPNIKSEENNKAHDVDKLNRTNPLPPGLKPLCPWIYSAFQPPSSLSECCLARLAWRIQPECN